MTAPFAAGNASTHPQQSEFRGPDSARIALTFKLLATLIGIWLAAAVALVNVDYGDAYSTVANAQYFLGTASDYFWQRGPMMALLLIPGEWLAQQLSLAPLDVRAHHAVMAVLHVLYLIGVWRILRNRFGSTAAALLGFVAAIPTVVYFSYAPFISHDIFPGLLLLWLLVVTDAFLRAPSWRGWLLFLAVSSTMVLVKQTYALAPLAVLLGRLLAVAFDRPALQREWRRFGGLIGAAVFAGILCWLTYATLLSSRFPEVPFLLRPLTLITTIGTAYEGQAELSELFYPWVYLRNASAYGIVAMTLVLPGIALAICGRDLLSRHLAVTWLLLVVAMHLTPFKEVRYLAYLAPLNAFLIIPVVERILRGPGRYRWLLGIVLLADVARAVPEAARITLPYYRDAVPEFFGPLQRSDLAQAPIFFGIGWLSFVSPERDAFFGDAFHRVTEMQVDQIRALYGWDRKRVFRIKLAAVAAAVKSNTNGVFLLQSALLSRRAPFVGGNLEGLPQIFVQTLSIIDSTEFVLEGDHYVVTDRPQMPRLLAGATGTPDQLAMVTGTVAPDMLRRYGGFSGLPPRVQLRVLAVLRLCRLDGCQSYAD